MRIILVILIIQYGIFQLYFSISTVKNDDEYQEISTLKIHEFDYDRTE